MPKKVTTEDFIKRASEVHFNWYDYSNTIYTRQGNEVEVICPTHGSFAVVAKLHTRSISPIGCPSCGKIRQGKPRSSTDEFIRKANEVHSHKYDYSLTEYTISANKVIVICPNHGPWKIKANGHLNGRGCPKCKRGGHNRLNTDEFVQRAKEIWGDLFDYSRIDYKSVDHPVEIICFEHGSFFQRAADHLLGKNGCVECAKKKHKDNLPTISYDEFLIRAKEMHQNQYEYEDHIENFLQSDAILNIKCKFHGWFKQKATRHITGRGCSKCGDKRSADIKRKPVDKFIEEAIKIHKGKYDYSTVEYTNNRTLVEIECPLHGKFAQVPDSHLRGAGCPRCSGRGRTTEEAIEEFKKVHGDRYDYSQVVYVDSDTPIKILCKKHGAFYQRYQSHIRGRNCPSCLNGAASKGENEVGEFVESLGVEVHRNLRNVIHPYELDIYVPEHNLAIEYCGLYWHSEKVGKTQYYHKMKHDLCAKKGIRLLTIFEDEWRDKQDIIKASIVHFLGKSPKGCPGRKAIVQEISWREAKPFLEEHHMLGAGTVGRYRVGAFDPNGNLIAVMVWGIPSDERGRTDAMEMKRYVCTKYNHPGLASKVFKWSIDNYGFDKVIAFIDLRFFEGNFKIASGFEKVSESNPTLFWTNGVVRNKRRFFTKQDLIKMPEFAGTNFTKKEMMEQMGFYRIWDCGKVKMEWVKES